MYITQYTAILKVPVCDNWVDAGLNHLQKVLSILQQIENFFFGNTLLFKEAPSAPLVLGLISVLDGKWFGFLKHRHLG